MGGKGEAGQLSTVYLDYDQAALDHQYNNAATVPDPNLFFDEYRKKSEEARATLDSRLDEVFGPAAEERLDIFPAGIDGAPTWIFIHGGFWRRLHKDDFSFTASALVPAGVSVAVVNYALAPAVSLAEIVRQSRAATAWVREHAHEWGGDPRRIFVGGHSAGGQLAGMIGAHDDVAGITSISGVHDLEPILLSNVNEWLRIGPEDVERFSPASNLPERALPLIAAVGTKETDEFRRQNALYATAWRSRGYPVHEIEMPGYNHYTMVLDLADPDSTLTQAIIAQTLAPVTFASSFGTA